MELTHPAAGTLCRFAELKGFAVLKYYSHKQFYLTENCKSVYNEVITNDI